MSDEPPRRPGPTFPDPNTEPSFEGMSYSALRRYVAGASDTFEQRQVAAWSAESPARRNYLEALGRTWARGQAAADAERTAADTAWTALRSQLEVPQADSVPPFVASWEKPAVQIDMRHRRPARLFTHVFDTKRRRTAPLIAAAMLLIAAGAFLFQQSQSGWEILDRSVAATEREVTTGLGQRAQIKLGDGSVVTLASRSRLRFPADFGKRRRELMLEGQAYFSVVHNPARPLVVMTRGSRTLDIGTAFVVRAYPEDERVQVVVTEGVVAFGRDTPNAAAPVRLTEGWMGQLAEGTGALSVQQVDPSRYTGWLTGQLIFDNTPLAEVASELSRWYDVQIRFADSSLARETFTAKFTAESWSETLRTLTTVLNLRADRQGKTVVLQRAR